MRKLYFTLGSKKMKQQGYHKTLMKQKSFLAFAVICIFSTSGCSAQDKENPEMLGSERFNLLKLSYNEDPLLLFKKVSYYKTSISNDDNSIIAHNFIVNKKKSPDVNVLIGAMDVSKYNYVFKVSKDGKFIGVSISFVSKEDVTKKILQNINSQWERYRTAINQLYKNPTIYRWEAPDRIIQLSYATFEGHQVYNISILSTKYDCSRFPLEKIFVGEDICLKKYKKKSITQTSSVYR